MNAGTRWIAIVIGLLAANVLAVVILIGTAGDPSPRVVPDSYQRALDYDRTMAERTDSAALGWGARLRLIEISPGRGRVELELTDRAAAPLAGATVAVEVRQRSLATGVTVALTESAPGRYAGEVAVTGRGLHELGLRAQLGALGFASAQTISLEAAP